MRKKIIEEEGKKRSTVRKRNMKRRRKKKRMRRSRKKKKRWRKIKSMRGRKRRTLWKIWKNRYFLSTGAAGMQSHRAGRARGRLGSLVDLGLKGGLELYLHTCKKT